MTAQAVSVIWWIVGTFGVVGLIALWFLAPTVATMVFRAIGAAFSLVLRYRVGCALLAAIVAGLVVDHLRHSYDDAQSAQRAAAFEAAQTARDSRIASETRERVWKEIADATAQNTVIDTTVKEFTDALPAAKPDVGNPFLVGADSCKLRALAGQTGCGPSSDKGMPKARRASGSSGDRAKIRLPEIIRTGVGSTQ